MRINTGMKAAVLVVAAGAMLAACSSDGDGDATASPSASASAPAAEAMPDVSGIVDSVRTATGCEPFAGGKVAGEGVVAGWQYTCDVDGDAVPEATLSIYSSADDLATDLTAVESASADTGIVQGDDYLFATTDADQLAAVSGLGGEVVRDLP